MEDKKSNFYVGLEKLGINPIYVCKIYTEIIPDDNDTTTKFPDLSKCVCGKDVKNRKYIINNKQEDISILMVGHGCLSKYIKGKVPTICGSTNDDTNDENDPKIKKVMCKKCNNPIKAYSENKYFCIDCYRIICRNCEESERYKNHPYCVKCIKQLYGKCEDCNTYHNLKGSQFCIKCSNKPRCIDCKKVMKNDKYKKCYSCLLKNEKKCRICGKTHYGKFPNCYTCWMENKYKPLQSEDDIDIIYPDIEVI